MIRSDAEYSKAKRDLELALARLEEERSYWLDEGMKEDEALVMLQPLRLRIAELRDQVELFKRIHAGDLSMFTTYEDIGRALIAARLARDLTQREFAELVGVHESQVSRYEKNEYHGVGAERMRDLMSKLGLGFEGHFHLNEIVVHPFLVAVNQPAVYRQSAGLTLEPEEVVKDLKNAVA